MIDLNKFKNEKGNEANRAQITQIGVLEVIDAYFNGSKDFTEEQVKRMVSNNITKIGIFETIAAGTNTPTDTPTTEPTTPVDPDPDPDPDPEQQPEGDGEIEVEE